MFYDEIELNEFVEYLTREYSVQDMLFLYELSIVKAFLIKYKMLDMDDKSRYGFHLSFVVEAHTQPIKQYGYYAENTHPQQYDHRVDFFIFLFFYFILFFLYFIFCIFHFCRLKFKP